MAYRPHILIVSYPARGHLNPSLQFAGKLLEIGVEVTISTSKFAHHLITKASWKNTSKSFNFVPISDGYDDGFNPQGFDVDHLNALQKSGREELPNIIKGCTEKGSPITCIVYTILLTWAAEVAREHSIPATLLWIQPATVLGIYYNYFNGCEDEIKNHSDEPDWSIQWPGLPRLSRSDLPSFLLPSSSNTNYVVALQMFKEQMRILDEEKDSIVLVNTFDALEPNSLKSIDKYKMIGIGPLIDFPFPEENVTENSSLNVDDHYLKWLNSKENRSVIYIAFGSITTPSKQQMEEIARGLLESGKKFLWVVRTDEDEQGEKNLSCIKELEEKGKIVPWCSQIEVLKHPSTGCFLTHCGWNSTLESIILGVPVIAFPQWTDQTTNAKLLQDVWGTGVRVVPNKDGIVERKEIKRCVELVMDDENKGTDLRKNVETLKGLAMDAMKENGSSSNNLKAFVFK